MIVPAVQFLLLLAQCLALKQISDFKSGIFQSSQPAGFFPVWSSNYEQAGQILLAYADFNGDKFTDIVSMDNSKTALNIHLWSTSQRNLQHNTEILIIRTVFLIILSQFQYCQRQYFQRQQQHHHLCYTRYPIRRTQTQINLVSFNFPSSIADYDSDASNDILLVLKDTSLNKYQIQIYFQESCSEFECTFSQAQLPADLFTNLDPVQPFLLDPFGTSNPCIFIMKDGTRKVLVPVPNNSSQYNVKDWYEYATNLPGSLPTLSQHFASLIDFTGDCKADLILVSGPAGAHKLEFYELRSDTLKAPYAYIRTVQLNMHVSRITFTDLNADGTPDLIMLVQDQGVDDTMYVEIHYNKNANSQICTPYSSTSPFPFDFFIASTANDSTNASYKSVLYIQRLKLPYNLSTASGLSFGDANTDGYPDLAVLLLDSNSHQKPFLLLSMPIPQNEASNFNQPFLSQSSRVGRIFNTSPITTPISQSSEAASISFFDFLEDGKLDVIINVVQALGSSSPKYTIQSIVNNLNEDSFFIKAMPASSFSSDEDSKISHAFGVTFQWKITTLEGLSAISLANQLSQVSHRSLQLPYILVGLGRTNNYLQQFTVGYMGTTTTKTWTPIIPNSQLIVIPDVGEADWTLGVYVSPNQKIKAVIIITAIILLVIGILILYQHRKEAEEDRSNQFMFFQLIR